MLVLEEIVFLLPGRLFINSSTCRTAFKLKDFMARKKSYSARSQSLFKPALSHFSFVRIEPSVASLKRFFVTK